MHTGIVFLELGATVVGIELVLWSRLWTTVNDSSETRQFG